MADDRLLKKSDFTRLNPRLDIKTPRCPLCHDSMVRERREVRGIYVFACNRPICKIVIAVDDPFVNRWEEALEKSTEGRGIPCPRPGCETPMRYFATSTGYMKTLCPKCGASVASAEPDRDKDHATTPENPGVIQ